MICNHLSAHEIRPAYLEIREKSVNEFTVFWKQPTMEEFSLRLKPQMGDWLSDSTSVTSFDENFLIKQWDIHTGKDILNGQKIIIEGLNSTHGNRCAGFSQFPRR